MKYLQNIFPYGINPIEYSGSGGGAITGLGNKLYGNGGGTIYI